MSEFKFACPVCGQHITADSKAAGTQLECPTCFRKIVVPQAPSSADPKFILSATMADKPRPPQAAGGPATLGPMQRRPGRTSVSIGLVLLLLAGTAGSTLYLLRGKIFRRPPPPPRAVQPVRMHGAIGLGSWNTQVEYTDVVVTKGTRTLYRSNFTNGAPDWRIIRGDWYATNGVFVQRVIATDCHAIVGDTGWSDYTLNLRARKFGGREGFLILFNVLDDRNWTWWNLGGWENTRCALEHCVAGAKSPLGRFVPGHIETGRWYDVRIELHGPRIRCYLDNELIEETAYPPPPGGSPAVPPEPPAVGSAAEGPWKMDLTGAVFPGTNATGRVHGAEFTCDRAVLQGGTLHLRQGKTWPPDLGVSVYLPPKEGEAFSGQSVNVAAFDASAPRIVLRWKVGEEPVTRTFHQGCVMKLEFGQAASNQIPGKIYLCVPDESRSYVAGTFNAEIRKPSPPRPRPPRR